MSQHTEKTWDVTNCRPKAILIGNGLCQTKNKCEWKAFLNQIAKRYPNLNSDAIPYTIRATAITESDDTSRRQAYQEALSSYPYVDNPLISKLLSLPFDAFLTTNYTYDLEYQLKKDYPRLGAEQKRKYVESVETDPSGGLIYAHNTINGKEIWHIHGEQRRKSSLVVTHDEYARQTQRILAYLAKRRDNYKHYETEVKFKSWVDYFILADLYIIGQGFDFCEFDLWWLLSRRLRERAPVGKVYYYSPDDEKDRLKLQALEALNVTCITYNLDALNPDYTSLYNNAIEDMRQKLRVCD